MEGRAEDRELEEIGEGNKLEIQSRQMRPDALRSFRSLPAGRRAPTRLGAAWGLYFRRPLWDPWRFPSLSNCRPMPKPSTQEFYLDAFSIHLDAETPRGCGVLGAALLDAKLKSLFRRRFRAFHNDLLGKTGPLGSFGVRILTARALAWISEDVRVDLDNIRRIRDNFAHNDDHMLDFNNPSITDRCANLRTSQAFINGFDTAAAAPRNLSSQVIRSMQSTFATSRWRYQLTVEFLAQYLDDLPADTSEYNGPDLLAEVHSRSANDQIRISGHGTVGPATQAPADAPTSTVPGSP